MNLRASLLALADKIKTACPKLSPNNNLSDEDEKLRLSIMSDIQQKFAEIYGIIIRETADDSLAIDNKTVVDRLELTTNDALKIRLVSIFQLVSTVALAIKTKINVAETQHIFDQNMLQQLNNVCEQCYHINHTLQLYTSETSTEEEKNEFNHGIIPGVMYRYGDYKTGIEKLVMSKNSGQLMVMPIGTADQIATYLALTVKARQHLDAGYKPNPEQIWAINNSPSNSAAESKVLSMFQGIFQQAVKEHLAACKDENITNTSQNSNSL